MTASETTQDTIEPTTPATGATIAFILVVAILDIVSMGIIIPVLPRLIEDFAGSSGDAGWINGVFVALWAAFQFVASPVIGSLSDRYGRRPVILLSAAGLAADYVLMALAPDLWWLALGRIITGVTSSSFTTVYAYMADVTPPEGRAKAFGLIGAAFGGGFILGPLLGGVLGELGPRAPFWFAAGISAIVFAYGLFVLPESLPAEKRMAFSWKRANPFGAMMLLRRHTELTSLALVTFLLHFSHHVFSAVWVLYAIHRFGWSAWHTGVTLACVGVLDMVVQGLIVGRLSKRFGDRLTMIFGLLGGTVGLVAMGLAPTPLLFVLTLLPNALWGLAMPTLQSLMTKHVSESEQGQLQGANMSVAAIAGVASPLFFGWIYSITVQPGWSLAWSGASFVIAAVILLGAVVIGVWAARQVAAAAAPAE